MIPIYVCDDDQVMARNIQAQIEKHCMIQAYEFQIELVTGNPLELIQTIKKTERRGIYFLDVDLKNEALDGFSLGKEIRKYDPKGFLVYITGHHDLAFKTFQYHLEALDYIEKDNTEKMLENIRSCIDTIAQRIIESCTEEKEVYYTVKIGGLLKAIPVNEIYYFETANTSHRINLYTADERVDFIGNLKEIEKKMGTNFIRCHRSFLVNKNMIESVQLKNHILVLKNQEKCYLSRKMRSKVIQLIAER